MSDQELIEEYRQREIRWNEKSLEQFGFFNNLILTLAVGFLAFTYQKASFKSLYFTTENIYWHLTLTVFSMIAVVLSIITGLIVAIGRLYDFRLTRRVNQIRHRMLEHAGIKMDESTPQIFNWFRRSLLPFEVLVSSPNISIEQCKAFIGLTEQEKVSIKFRFRELRNVTHNLGRNSWRNTGFQILFFGIGILLYLMGELAR